MSLSVPNEFRVCSGLLRTTDADGNVGLQSSGSGLMSSRRTSHFDLLAGLDEPAACASAYGLCE